MLGAYVRLNAKMLAASCVSVPTSTAVAVLASGLEPHVAATYTLLWAYFAWYCAFAALAALERRRNPDSPGLRAYFAGMGAPLLAGEAAFVSALWYFYYLALVWGWDPAVAYLAVNGAAYVLFLAVVNVATRLDIVGRFKSRGATSAA